MGTGRNFLEGALRGSASALRGYMEAKVGVAQARNQQELSQAEYRLAQERNRLLKQKQDNDFQLSQQNFDLQGSIAEMQHNLGQLTLESQERMTGSTNESQERITQTTSDANVKSAEIGAKGQVDATKAAGDSQVKSAEIGAKGQLDATKAAGDAQVKGAQIQADALTGVAGIEAQSEKEIAEIKNRPMLGGTGKPAVSGDAAMHFGRTYDRVARSLPYKIIESSQNAIPRVLALYEDGVASESDDIALMNIFQRMIDPGVSVREGDVDLQRSNATAWEQWGLFIERFNTDLAEGKSIVLPPNVRKDIIRTALDLANEDYDVLLPKLQEAGQNWIGMNEELSRAGYDIQDFFFQPMKQWDGEVELLPSGAVRLQGGVAPVEGAGPDGRMPAEGEQMGADVSAAIQTGLELVQAGMGVEDVIQMLTQSWSTKGVPSESIAQVIQGIRQALAPAVEPQGQPMQQNVQPQGQPQGQAPAQPQGQGAAQPQPQAVQGQPQAQQVVDPMAAEQAAESYIRGQYPGKNLSYVSGNVLRNALSSWVSRHHRELDKGTQAQIVNRILSRLQKER